MAFRNTFEEDTKLLNHAARRGLVNLKVCFESPTFKLLQTLNRSTVPRATIQNIDQNSQALKTQVHTFDRTEVFNAANDHLIELARITVPQGNVGHLECIEQYLADVDGLFYASSSQYWGMPYNETVAINDIVWLFRLDNYYGNWVPRFYQTALVLGNYRALLPGSAWHDLPEFNGLWYPAHHRKGLHGTIPSGMQLRFFAYVPNTALEVYSWRLSGRLTARLQSELCTEAQQNTRVLQ